MTKRHTNNQRPRENDRRSAQREFRRALHATAQEREPFGIRRRLVYESQAPIVQTAHMLLEDDEIDSRIQPRQPLHVTEMPKITVSSQMSRGIVLGYELRRRLARKQTQIERLYSDRVIVSIGKCEVFKRGNLGFRIHSDELEREYRDIRLTMGQLGVKGTMRDVEPLHITWADAPRDVPRRLQQAAIGIMNEVREDSAKVDITSINPAAHAALLYVPPTVVLDPIEFYPGRYE